VDRGGTFTDLVALPRNGPLVVPMVAIHTVAAGSGSVIHCDGERLRVGPAAAGAAPGPAAYRRGGPATLTDANVVLGRLQPQFFSKVFGPQGDSPLDREASRAALASLARRLETATGLPHSPEQVAAGAIAIATARMAEAIKQVSVQRGHAINNAVVSRKRHQAPWTRRLAGRTPVASGFSGRWPNSAGSGVERRGHRHHCSGPRLERQGAGRRLIVVAKG